MKVKSWLVVLFFFGLMTRTNLNAQVSGDIDLTFKTSKTFGPDMVDHYVARLKVTPDNSLLYSGYFSHFSDFKTSGLVRLNSEAEVDTTFRVSLFQSAPNGFEILPDGKILLWGGFRATPASVPTGIVRLLPYGEIDPSFSSDTTTKENLAMLANGNMVAIDHQNGHKIRGYLSNGQAIINFNLIPSNYDDVLIGLPNSGFLVYSNSPARLIKYSDLGQLDTSFHFIGSLDWSPEFYPLSNGKVLATGYGKLFRILPSGQLDPTFLNGVSLPGSSQFQMVDSAGNVFLSTLVGYDNAILKFKPNGQLDSSFSFNKYLGVGKIVPFQDGWFFMGSTNQNNWLIEGFDAFRLTEDGTQIWKKRTPGFDGRVEKLILYPDKRILLGGTFSHFDGISTPLVARLFPDGSLDTSFHSPFQPFVYPNVQRIESISLGADGRILVKKTMLVAGSNQRRIPFILLPNGNIDTSFHFQIPSFSGDTIAILDDILLASNQRIYSKFDISTVNHYPFKSLIVRHLMNGSLDPEFTPKTYLSGPNDNLFTGLHQDTDSTLFLENSFAGFTDFQGIYPPSISSLFRIRLDGTVKENFHFSGPGGEVKSIQTDSAGNLYLACLINDGTPEGWAGYPVFMKIRSNGTEDMLFRSELSIMAVESFDFDLIPYGFTHTKIGEMIQFQSTNPMTLIKKCADGTNDPAFTSSFANGGIYTMLSTDSNSFYVAGGFNQINGQPVNRIARLKNYSCMLTGVEPTSKREEITVFPNPGKDILEIRLGSVAKAEVEVGFFDFQGRKMAAPMVSTTSNNNQFTVNVSGLSQGIYLLKINAGSQQKTVKWIKE